MAVDSINCKVRVAVVCVSWGLSRALGGPCAKAHAAQRKQSNSMHASIFHPEWLRGRGFFEAESDRPDGELQADLQLDRQSPIVICNPHVQMAGAAEQHVIEQVDFVEDRIDRAELRLQRFAPLRLDLSHYVFLPVAHRNLRSLARLQLYKAQRNQAADQIVNTTGNHRVPG